MAGKTKKETQEEVKTEETVAETTEQEENKQEVAENTPKTPETSTPEETEQVPDNTQQIEEAMKEELKGVELPVSVFDNGRLVRTYNKNDHGDDYKEKAIMFANKNGYQIK
jgi:O6-methylguanine-DNA--protein-cysteine methyltransferase